MGRITFYSLTEAQLESTRRLRRIALWVLLAAIIVVGVMSAFNSGMMGRGASNAIGRDLSAWLFFVPAIIGMVAIEVLLYCSRLYYIHDSVTKGLSPRMNATYVVLMILLGVSIIFTCQSFLKR